MNAEKQSAAASRQESGHNQSAPTAKIVLWGPSAAGKTMLLAQLYLQSVHFQSGWQIRPSPEAEAFISDMTKTIKQENSFPGGTPVEFKEQVTYRFFDDSNGSSAALTIDDRSGKHYEEMTPETRRHLAEADGLVLLFDPLRDKEALQSEVTGALQSIYFTLGKENSLDDRPYAVCLSKADTQIRSLDDLLEAQRDPHNFVLRRIQPELVKWIGKYCSNYRFFPVSSVGLRATAHRIEPVVFFDERLRGRLSSDARPLNLMEPFAWLLGRLEGAA